MSEKDIKMHVKLGDAEFTAEGPEGTVNEQFKMFLEALSGASERPRKPAEDATRANIPNQSERAQQPEDALLNGLFAQDNKGVVSLRHRIQTANPIPDSLLLLLYGYRVLTGQDMVLATKVNAGLQQSGVTLNERVDRSLGPNEEFIRQGGRAGGKNYGLNNLGVNRAEELLREVAA